MIVLPVKTLPHGAMMKSAFFLQFLADQRKVSPKKLQQPGQFPSHERMFPYIPAIFIAAMAYRNI